MCLGGTCVGFIDDDFVVVFLNVVPFGCGFKVVVFVKCEWSDVEFEMVEEVECLFGFIIIDEGDTIVVILPSGKWEWIDDFGVVYAGDCALSFGYSEVVIQSDKMDDMRTL